MATIRFEQVSKRYDKATVVDNVSLEVHEGEFMVLVGPSGCGKSTLLRMIAGLEDITTGKLYLDGHLANNLAPKDRDIAIVFQNYALYPHMTAYENLAFGLKIRGLSKTAIHEKVVEAARILDIAALLDRKPKAMSGGQRQRVAIGRAIVRQPKVFLFDEPLSNLDAKLRGQMRLEIARLHKQLKTTVVYVTHDQVEAMTLGDRIAVVNNGKIQQIDTPQQLYDNPANRFVAGFIGSPQMNFIEGKIVQTLSGPVFSEPTRQLVLPLLDNAGSNAKVGQPLTFGIRPEHLHTQPIKGEQHYAAFNAEVQLVERLGHESFAFAKLGEQQVVARLAPEVSVVVGEQIRLYAEVGRGRFFWE